MERLEGTCRGAWALAVVWGDKGSCGGRRAERSPGVLCGGGQSSPSDFP